MDSVDAALAALTGLRAIEGEYQSYGVDGEWLVVPSSATTGRFERCR